MPLDLLLHALVGYALTTWMGLGPVRTPPLAALAVGVGVGVAKELRDDRKGGSGFDARDLAATALGASGAYVQLRWTF